MSQSTQFLNSVLYQIGPSALPYDEEINWLIGQHLVALEEEFQNMEFSTSIFNHNDGTIANLINAQGTIPMLYREVTYNIPITIWLLESYCMQPPLVYVTPTSEMVIKRHHPFVDASGLVSSSYLMNWDFPSSNLVDMVKNLSILFGQNPPLFTSADQNLQQSHGGGDNPIRPPQQHDHHQLKKEAINKLVESFQNDIAKLKKTSEGKIDENFSMQDLLRARQDELDRGLGELQEEKEILEQQLQSIFNCTGALETRLQVNETKQSDFDIDDVFEACDVLSKQMLESSAADQAIEDLLYSLDKAVQDGAIPVEAYLKNVRALSREQFFHRAKANKVETAQLQSGVAHMETTACAYVSLLQQIEDTQNCNII